MKGYQQKERYRGDVNQEFVFVHLMSRSIQPTYFGCRYPFSEDDKFYMVNLLKRLDRLFCFDILSYCIMDNHFHVVIRIAKGAENNLSRSEVKRRYEEFYRGKRPMDARSLACYTLKNKLNNFSHFMWLFLRMTSFRHNRLCKRRGPLWQNKFKSVIIESSAALAMTLKYVELNPVRAKMVKNPAEYKWSSWGEMRGGHYHPYRQRIIDSLRWSYSFPINRSDGQIFAHFGQELTRLSLLEYDGFDELKKYFPGLIYHYLLEQGNELTHSDRVADIFIEEFKT